MNVRDCAHALAKSVKQSEEFSNYKIATKKVQSDKKCDSMLKDFRTKQVELQRMEMSGIKIDESNLKKIQDLYNVISLNPTITDFFIAERNFIKTIDEVYKIIGESIDINKK